MEFLVSEVPLQNQLFLVFWNFKVMNNKFLIMSVCKHMETLQLGFFPMNSAAVRTFAVDTYFLSVWVCSVFVSFLVTVDVDWTVTAFDSFSADSLPRTEPVKVCAYFIKRNTKKSPNSLLYKTNQTTEQRSCYSKVDTVIKYNFLSCQCEISMKSCSSIACLYSQRGTVTGTCVRHQGTECALVCVIKDVLPV